VIFLLTQNKLCCVHLGGAADKGFNEEKK